MNVTMSYMKYPRIRMYWARKTRVPQIADVMSRNNFFLIQSNLTFRNYITLSQEEKSTNKFWKVWPLLQSVRQACNPRPQCLSIDEQMIPFHGQASARQYVRGKPNPLGLKNVVCASPDGLPVDFFLYQGKGDSIVNIETPVPFEIGEKVVLKLAETIPEGCSVYIDRYFSSVRIIDELHAKGIHGSGTLQKFKIPVACNLGTDADLQRRGRGSYVQNVRDDGQVSILKWLDSRPVVMISNMNGGNPEKEIRRWCKKTKKYINIQGPDVITQYNTNMGGIDLLDRMIAFYRIKARTRKWTVRVFFHFVDFAIAAAWIERRRTDKANHVAKKECFDLLDFKIDIAYSLLHQQDPDEEEVEDEREIPEGNEQKRRKTVPLPSPALRTTGIKHLPEIPPNAKPSRCNTKSANFGALHVKCFCA